MKLYPGSAAVQLEFDKIKLLLHEKCRFEYAKTWKASKTPPNGYRGCVEFLAKDQLVTCGLTGVDYTFDTGNTWEPISKESFHVVRIAKYGTTVYLAGTNGKIGKLVYDGRKRK